MDKNTLRVLTLWIRDKRNAEFWKFMYDHLNTSGVWLGWDPVTGHPLTASKSELGSLLVKYRVISHL